MSLPCSSLVLGTRLAHVPHAHPRTWLCNSLAAIDLLKAEQLRAYSTHIAVHGPLYEAAVTAAAAATAAPSSSKAQCAKKSSGKSRAKPSHHAAQHGEQAHGGVNPSSSAISAAESSHAAAAAAAAAMNALSGGAGLGLAGVSSSSSSALATIANAQSQLSAHRDPTYLTLASNAAAGSTTSGTSIPSRSPSLSASRFSSPEEEERESVRTPEADVTSPGPSPVSPSSTSAYYPTTVRSVQFHGAPKRKRPAEDDRGSSIPEPSAPSHQHKRVSPYGTARSLPGIHSLVSAAASHQRAQLDQQQQRHEGDLERQAAAALTGRSPIAAGSTSPKSLRGLLNDEFSSYPFGLPNRDAAFKDQVPRGSSNSSSRVAVSELRSSASDEE